MRKYHEILINAKRNKIVGNHKVEFLNNNNLPDFYSDDGEFKIDYPQTVTRAFTYFWTVICLVDDTNKCYWLTHNGFYTPSTNTALHGYRFYFDGLGYTNMNKIPVYKCEK